MTNTTEQLSGTLGFYPILEEEGFHFDPGILYRPTVCRGDQATNASLKLFNQILHPADPRWILAEEYGNLRAQKAFNGMNFHNALMATYLSPKVSWRNRGNHFSAEWTVRHLCRVLQNLKAKPFLERLHQNTEGLYSSKIDVELAQTESIALGSDDCGITGCPEALYQLRLFVFGDYAGRIGFNVHREGESDVLSIVNVQGVPDGNLLFYDWLPNYLGIDPFVYLVKRVKRYSDHAEDRPIIVRGMRNPRANHALINTVLKHERISRITHKIPPWEESENYDPQQE